MDALLLALDRGPNYTHTIKIAILDPSSDPDGWSFARYREVLAHHVVQEPLLKKRYLPTPLGVHRPIWVEDPDFDLDVHVRRVACPAPGGMAEFCALVEQVYAHPLDHGRPLWQVWAVEGLEADRVALLVLIHHAYADGAGVSGILDNMLTAGPVALPPGGPPRTDPPPSPTALKRLGWGLSELPELARAVPAALGAVRERRRIERQFGPEASSDRPTTAERAAAGPFVGKLQRFRRFACQSYALEQLREIRSTLGGTVNDVFVSCAAGSVREFLLRRDLPCRAPTVASMAFVTKPLAERDGQSGSFSSGDSVWLHAEIADPVERLKATTAATQATKDYFNAIAGADLMALLELSPGCGLSAIARFDQSTEGRYSPARNILLSNVPGPREALYIGRWRIQNFFSVGNLAHGLGLNFTAWSYTDQFNLGVLAGTPLIPDAWELVDGFARSLEELADRAGPSRHHIGTGGLT